MLVLVDRAVDGDGAGGQQPGDVAEHVEDGLAADLGRVGGDDGHDEQVGDQPLDVVGVDVGRRQALHRRGEAADLRARAVLAVEPAAPLVVHVLGRVGQRGQPAEGPDEVQLVVDRPLGERLAQRAERAAAVPAGVDGAPADLLDELEDVVAGLVPHDLAEQPAEQADVGADGGVLAAAAVATAIASGLATSPTVAGLSPRPGLQRCHPRHATTAP